MTKHYKTITYTAINKRIALLSSDEQTFKESTPIYQNALRHSNFDHEFTYTQDAPQRTRRNRQRNIIWFNPPFSKSVNTINIGREFLSLLTNTFHYSTNYTRFSTETL